MAKLFSLAWNLIEIIKAGELWDKRLEVLEIVGRMLLLIVEILRDNPAFMTTPVEPPETLEECILEIEQARKANPEALAVPGIVTCQQLCYLVLQELRTK